MKPTPDLVQLAQKMTLDYQKDRLQWNLNRTRGLKNTLRLIRSPVAPNLQDVLTMMSRVNKEDLSCYELNQINQVLSGS